MMHQSGDKKFFYSGNGDYQVLGMPYAGSEVFMFVVLPKERYGLEAVLKGLNGSTLRDIVKNRRTLDVDVSIPKFKAESTHDLKDHLQKMGVKEAFDKDKANLGGIADVSKEGQLYVSKAIQKAFIETNEEGSEAAASTAMQAQVNMMAMPEPLVFNADHPFIYTVVDGEGRVLFAGVVRGQ